MSEEQNTDEVLENEDQDNEDEDEEFEFYACYVFKDKNGFVTFLQPVYGEDDPELNVVANMKFYVKHFIADNPVDARKMADKFIRAEHKKEALRKLSATEIRKLNTVENKGSFVEYPDGSRLDIIPDDRVDAYLRGDYIPPMQRQEEE